MRGQLFCGAIGVLASLALAACEPYYGYGYGRGYNGYGPYGYTQYPYGPYGAYPQAPAAPPPYMVPQALSQTSYNFVTNLALNGSYEIEAGTMARQRAASQQIRQYADERVRGNTALAQQMATVLQNNGTPVVTSAALDPRHQAMIGDLSAVQGPEFDRRYVIQQVLAHQEAVATLQNYAQSGDNPALRQFAQQTLPAAQEGLRLAQMLPGAAGPAPSQYNGLAATSSATCYKGLLWPFVREPGDCPTDAEKFSFYSQ